MDSKGIFKFLRNRNLKKLLNHFSPSPSFLSPQSFVLVTVVLVARVTRMYKIALIWK